MARLFLSYARKNLRDATRLYRALSRSTNHEVWFDRVSLMPGVRWEPAIRKAIRESRYFLALFSKSSVSQRGYRHSELRQALEVLAEYPSDSVYLIPIRLDNCKMPDAALEALNRVDLFPNWSEGVRSIERSLGPAPTAKRAAAKVPKRAEFRVALLSSGVSKAALRKVAAGLNSVQRFFSFSVAALPTGSANVLQNAVTEVSGRSHFLVDRIPATFYEQSRYLAADLIATFTDEPLAFSQGDHLYYNYFSFAAGPQQRFLFLSSDLLADMAGIARQTLVDGLAYVLIGILVDFFTDTGYHDETRNCPLDHCANRLDIAYGLNTRKLCAQCAASISTPGLRAAVNAMLKWRA